MTKVTTFFDVLDRWLPNEWVGMEEQMRKGRLILTSSLLVVVICSGYIAFFAYLEHWMGLGTCLFGLGSAIVCIVLLRRTSNTDLSGNFFAACSFIVITSLTLSSYGMDTLIVVWLFMAPLSAVLMVGSSSGRFWTAMTMVLFVVLLLLDLNDVTLPASFDREYIPIVNVFSLTGFLLYASFSIIGNEEVKRITMRRLKATKEEIMEKKQELEDINAEILRVNRDLEEKVRQRTLGLELSKQELDTFLYESSHALRRPVVRLLGLSNVLRIADSQEEQENFLRAIEITATGMDKMLTDLLEVSELNSTAVNLREIHLRTFLVHLSESMGSGEMDLVCEVEEGKPVLADGALLGLALRKILENAIQYRKDNQAKAQILIRAREEEGKWQIEVRDEGKGVHPDAQADVFKMFVRGTEHSTGTGLGLYIADKAARRMNGALEIKSVLGEWTVFTLFLEK